MKAFSGVLLFCCLASLTSSTPISINKQMDKMLPIYNSKLREAGHTTYPLPEISVANVTYSNGLILGLDSTVRTGNSFIVEKERQHLVQVDCHIGLNLLTVFLPQLTVDGQKMSGYFRLRGNSAHFVYSLEIGDDKCAVSIQELSVDTFGTVEFSSSLQEYDGADLSEYFKSEVAPAVAGYIEPKKEVIAKLMGNTMCPNQNLVETLF